MKLRVLSSIVGLCLLAVAIFFLDTVLFNILVTLLGLIAVYEVLLATKYLENKLLAILCLCFAAVVPSVRYIMDNTLLPAICFFFAGLLFLLLLVRHSTMRIEQIGFAFFISLVVPMGFSVLLILRDHFPGAVGLFYILLSFAGAFVNDTCAFLVGRKLGKHKLCPNISPQKTVEGAIGGILGNVALFAVLGPLYVLWARQRFGVELEILWWQLLLAAPLAAVFGILGDLSASIIKRQCSVKDFGNIMPGHGGVLDRFDGWLFVGPFVYVFTELFPIVTVL